MSSTSGSDGFVGRVIEIKDARDIDRKELKNSGHAVGSGDAFGKQRFALIRIYESTNSSNRSSFQNIPDGMIELRETTNVTWVPASQIEDVAFVIHIKSMFEGKYLCAGMDNAYCIQCGTDADVHSP